MAADPSSGGAPSGGAPSDRAPRSSTPPAARPGATTAGRKNRGGKGDGAKNSGADAKVQTFRSPTALVIWVVWLLFAAANWVDLAVQGRDHASAVAAAILLLATGLAYAAAQRPRVIADEVGLTVRNPLRDYRIAWASVTKVDLVDLLRVHCDWGRHPGASPDPKKHTKVISSWAVHYSRRRQVTAESKARRAARPRRSTFSLGSGTLTPAPVPASAAEAEAEKIVRLLNERATAAQEPATLGSATGWLEPIKSTWSRKALAAILIPALILLIVCLV